MLTKSTIQFLQSLAVKKNRREEGVFLAEGVKIVGEILHSRLEVVEIFALAEWFARHDVPGGVQATQVNAAELKRISQLTTPNEAVAVVRIPDWNLDAERLRGKLVIAVDDLQDPGNLGTIIRSCDWFGVETILASPNTVDCFSPKVVQATMGSIVRVQVITCDLAEAARSLGKPTYAATLDGESLFDVKLAGDALIVFGNESRGVKDELAAMCSKRISIPRHGANRGESLNVAMSASIVMAEARRQTRDKHVRAKN